MGRRCTVIVALAAVGAASGCGGGGSSKTLTHTAFVAKANAICTRLHTRLDALGAGNAKEAAQIYSQAATLERTMLTEFRELNPPTNLATDWKQFVAAVNTLAEDSTRYSEYIAAKNTSGGKALAISFGQVKQQTHTVVLRDGLTACAVTF